MCAAALPTSWELGLHHGETSEPCFVPGVWGPLYSEWCPGSGSTRAASPRSAAIDHLIRSHPAYSEASRRRVRPDGSPGISRRRVSRARAAWVSRLLARDNPLLPEFLGNRVALAAPIPGGRRRDDPDVDHWLDGSGCSSRGCADLPRDLQMSSSRFDRTAWIAT